MLLLNACQKENSFESGGGPADASLQSDVNGDCLPKNVIGVYEAGTPLSGATNYIEVDLDVTATGTYTVYTDTVNGVYFRLSGTFTALGNQTIKLRGFGTPAVSGSFNFRVRFEDQECLVPVDFLPSGSGGPATFALVGAPGACSPISVVGNYAVGVALSASNTATITVDVSVIGTYNITTTYQGMTFSKSGAFTATGIQSVTLAGSGTPTTAGSNVVPVTAGTSTCTFDVSVGNAAAGTLGGGPGACTPSTPAGTYTVGTALDATNTVQIQVNFTTAGVYSITTNTVTGFSFAASGTAAATGTQTITLNGTGTPTTAGVQTFTVTFGTSTCTFPITVVAAPTVIDYFPRTTNSNWSYEINDDANDSLLRYVIAPTHSALGSTYNIFMFKDGGTIDSSGYYRKSGTDYREFFDVGGYIGYDNPQWVDYIFVKDAAAGTNWKSAGYAGTSGGQNFNIRFSNTILQKDVAISFTTSLGTMNFTNVIVVEEKYEIEVTPGVWQDLTPAIGFGKAFYARNIGLIKYEVYDETSTLTDWQELRRYSVF